MAKQRTTACTFMRAWMVGSGAAFAQERTRPVLGQSVRLLTLVALLLAMGLIAGVTPARAQDGPVTFNIGVGPIAPAGDVADNFDTGFTFPVGVGVAFSENFEFQFEYMYENMDGPSTTVPNLDPDNPGQILLETSHPMHTGTFNVIVKTPTRGTVGGYFVAGPGFYHRIVDLTTPDVGIIRVCNPWWFVCAPVAVPVDRVIASSPLCLKTL